MGPYTTVAALMNLPTQRTNGTTTTDGRQLQTIEVENDRGSAVTYPKEGSA